MLTHVPDPMICILLGAVALGAFAQRTTGIGFTLLAGPACALVLEPSRALGTVVRLAIVADLLVLLADRARLDWRSVGAFLRPAALALPFALVASSAVPPRALVATAAAATVVAALALRSADAAPRAAVAPSGTGGARVAGFAAGFLGVTTGMAGPPLALHASLSGRPLAAGRATMTMFFLAVDLAALATHRTAAGPGLTLALVGALLAGAAMGGPALRHLSDERVRRAIPPLVLAGACTALVRVVG